MGRALLAILLVACAGRVRERPVVEVVEPAPPPPAPRRAIAPREPVARVNRLEQDRTPAGPTCESSSGCGDGRHCRGPAGCEAAWACGEARECGAATVSYCGCDGITFYALENCPGTPILNVGPCAAMGPDAEAAIDDPEEEDSTICLSESDCSSGYVCAGIEGCSTHWTCVRRRRVRCRAEPTTFCSCDSETFSSPSTCAGRPILHRGECGAPMAIPEPPPLVGGPPPEVDPRRDLGDPR